MSTRHGRGSDFRGAQFLAPALAFVFTWIVLVGTPGIRGAEWVSAAGYRWRALESAGAGKPGFTRLNGAATGIMFTNHLDERAGAANRVLYNGAGVAAGDVDGDGLPDLFLCQLDGRNALYRNRGGFRFEDVTDRAGLAGPRPGTRGAVLADINGDRRLDLLMSINGKGVACFTNDGRGVFREVTVEAGTAGPKGSTSMALADVDGNGTLDLYVANYRPDDIRDRGRVNVRMVNGRPIMAGAETNRFVMLRGRLEEAGQPDQLFLNDGAGHFNPVSWTGGAFLDERGRVLSEAPTDWGLTATFRDLDGDGAPDLYVCNDYWTPDRIWWNDGHGGFRAAGSEQIRKICASSMSVDFADLDRDGRLDFFVVDMLSRFPSSRKRQMTAQPLPPPTPGFTRDRPQVLRNTLFLGRGDRLFSEVAFQSGVAATDWSWSALFLDVDLDGYEDLLVGAGHFRDVQDIDAERIVQSRQGSRQGFRTEAERQQAFTTELMEHFRLYPKLDLPLGAFRNRGDATFEETTRSWGLEHPAVHQGLALADFDGDGDLDLADNTLNSELALYRNESGAGRIAVRLAGRSPNTAGIGARVTLTGGAVPRQTSEMVAGGRYLSGSDTELVFATGKGPDGFGLEVIWRSGRTNRLVGLTANRVYEIEEPAGIVAEFVAVRGPAAAALFEDVSERLGLRHEEDAFDEFPRQPLLPFRRAWAGPALAWGDVDGDGSMDLVMGSQAGAAVAVRLGATNGLFRVARGTVGVSEGSADGAGVLVLPGPEGGTRVLAGNSGYRSGQPRALEEYAVAQGVWSRRSGSVGTPGQASTLAWSDPFGRGQPLLFVAGGLSPGRYPLGAAARLYRGEAGGWALDARTSAQFENLGIVRGATWTDLDGDGNAELVLACEWGPLRVFRFQRGFWADVTREWGLLPWTGWWAGVSAGDFNGDGRMDLVASNWGWNSPYAASPAKPLIFAFGELAQPGVMEVVETEWDQGRLAPSRAFAVLLASLPFLAETFPTARRFAETSLDELLGERAPLSRRVSATTLASTVFLNTGAGFRVVPLPREAQVTPVHGIAVADFDGDGHEDLFLAQNFSGTSAEIGKLDAGLGQVLLGDGAGGWRALSPESAGVRIAGDQRAAAVADFDGDGRVDLAVSQNGGDVRLFRNRTGRAGVRVVLRGPPANPTGAGAVLRWVVDGQPMGPAREIHAGGGYWSQDSAVQVMPRPARATGIRVRWPGGQVGTRAVAEDARQIEIAWDPAAP